MIGIAKQQNNNEKKILYNKKNLKIVQKFKVHTLKKVSKLQVKIFTENRLGN